MNVNPFLAHRPLCSHAVRFVLSKEMAENIVAELFSAFRETARYRTYGIPAGVPDRIDW